MLEMLRTNDASSIGTAVQKLNKQRGLGARVALWLLDKFGKTPDGQPIKLDAVDGAIAGFFGVSAMTARRWRSGTLPPNRYLEDMRARWGMPFVLFIFADAADDGQRTLLQDLQELEDIDRQQKALGERKAVVLGRISTHSLYQRGPDRQREIRERFAELVDSARASEHGLFGRLLHRLAGRA